MSIAVISIGTVDAETTQRACAAIEEQFHTAALVQSGFELPAEAYDRQREQYSSFVLLRELARSAHASRGRVLGVTDADLFIPMLTFVFGQAQFEGHVALASAARLKQEFYGLPADRDLLQERLAKEVAHELGHTFGLVHCADPSCIMSLANNIVHVDRKRNEFCRDCRALLDEKVSELRNVHEDKLADSRRR